MLFDLTSDAELVSKKHQWQTSAEYTITELTNSFNVFSRQLIVFSIVPVCWDCFNCIYHFNKDLVEIHVLSYLLFLHLTPYGDGSSLL